MNEKKQSPGICKHPRRTGTCTEVAEAADTPRTDGENGVFALAELRPKLHFLGAGGISMSTLALIAKQRGKTVTGYDRSPSRLTRMLEEAGIPVYTSLDAAHLAPDMAVVYTAAISEDNAELAAAREMGLPCITRAEYLGGIMQSYRNRVGVSGTHGKSTVTSMLYHIFSAGEKDPTVACGAEIPALGAAYRLGGKEQFLYEACEYTDSFLHFHPTVAVILNIDLDHVDYFKSIDQMIDSFHRSIREAAVAVANFEDQNVRLAVRGYEGKLVSAGISAPDALYRAEGIEPFAGGSRFLLTKGGQALCTVTLKLPGRHNVLDAVCAAAAAIESGCTPEAVSAGLAAFRGAKRRFEYKGSFGGALLYDDYAHHPTEISATLEGARGIARGRLFCIFQPHTYSRTAGLLPDFAAALSAADKVVLAPIFAAREKNTFGIGSEDIARRIPGAVCFDSFPEIARYVKENVLPGDLVITMGAGNICDLDGLLLS